MSSRQGLFVAGILLLAVGGLGAQQTGSRAASSQVNCGCQCSNLTFRDKYGQVQGNCKSADHTGATWCYVKRWGSSCQDKRSSKRFREIVKVQTTLGPPG